MHLDKIGKRGGVEKEFSKCGDSCFLLYLYLVFRVRCSSWYGRPRMYVCSIGDIIVEISRNLFGSVGHLSFGFLM